MYNWFENVYYIELYSEQNEAQIYIKKQKKDKMHTSVFILIQWLPANSITFFILSVHIIIKQIKINALKWLANIHNKEYIKKNLQYKTKV